MITRRSTFLPFSPPTVGEEEIAEVVEALRSGWITTGPRVRSFESGFADHLDAPGAVALSSCTAGMHAGLLALGVGAGDEVIIPSLTFCATANVVEHVGARPVFVDVEPDTLTVDPRAVEAAVTSRTKAVLPVHYAGHPAELDPLLDLAGRHGHEVLEDAAHALPAAYRGRPVGSGPNPVAFSFYATKNLTTGEGGMLTGDPDLLERVRIIGLHGMSRDAWKRYEKGGSWYYEVVTPGFKYNMTDMQAALGIKQLERLPEFQRRRRAVVRRYQTAFAGHEALETPVERDHVEHAWHLYVLRLRLDVLTIDRARFIHELAERNIGTSVHFIPVHTHPWYAERYGLAPGALPVTWDAYQRMLSLPLHPGLGDDDVDDVIEAVLDTARTYRR